MNEELDKIGKNQTLEIVPRQKNRDVVGSKQISRNKFNEYCQVLRNKARLLYKGYY